MWFVQCVEEVKLISSGNFDFVSFERGAQAKMHVGPKDAWCLLATIFMQQMYLFMTLTSYYFKLKLHLSIKIKKIEKKRN